MRWRELALILGLNFSFLMVAINIQSGWLYLIVALTFALIGVSFFLPRIALNGLEVSRNSTSHVFEGDPIAVTLRVRNSGHFTRYFFQVVDRLPSFVASPVTQQFAISVLPGKKEITLQYFFQTRLRGEHFFHPVELRTGLPFGLYTHRKKLSITHSFLVFPKVINLDRFPLYGHHSPWMNIDSVLSRGGNGQDFFGVREYRTGDPLRQIHWRSSARHCRLVVKEFEDRYRPNLSILLDLHPDAHVGEDAESTLEYMVKMAASIISYSLNRGNPTELIVAKGKEICRKGHLNWWEALEFLARVKSESEIPLAVLLERIKGKILPHSSVVLVTTSQISPPPFLLLWMEEVSEIILILLIAGSFMPGDREKEWRAIFPRCDQAGIKLLVYRRGEGLKSCLEERW